MEAILPQENMKKARATVKRNDGALGQSASETALGGYPGNDIERKLPAGSGAGGRDT